MVRDVIHIPVDVNISSKDIDDIITGALEGGINYWCHKATVVGAYLGEYVSEQISKGGSLLLYDYVEGKEYELTLQNLLKGLQRWICTVRGKKSITLHDGNLELNFSYIDGPACDSIIQYALFDDIIYA